MNKTKFATCGNLTKTLLNEILEKLIYIHKDQAKPKIQHKKLFHGPSAEIRSYACRSVIIFNGFPRYVAFAV